MIGIAGASGVGKTTLARQFCLQSGTHFLETNSSETFKRLGLDLRADYPFDTRMMIQEELLIDLCEAYERAPMLFVADRTPVDLMAYTLADVTRAMLTKAQDERVMSYLGECEAALDDYFDCILVLQPGIDAESKCSASKAYQTHINGLCCGLMRNTHRNRVSGYIVGHEILDLDHRISVVNEIASDVMKEHLSLSGVSRKTASLHKH